VTLVTTERIAAQVRIDTWKALAQYLGRSSRTVQRWHAEYGLPVRHLGGDSGSVYAFTDELDDWLRERGRTVTARSTTQVQVRVQESSLHHQSILDNSASSFQLTSEADENRAAHLIAIAKKIAEASSQANLSGIARLYREAIDLDPRNARAFAGLSLALIAQGLLGPLHPLTAYAPARAALRSAMEIDPALLEVTCASAALKLVVERDWNGAREGFDEALARDPACTFALAGRAMLHVAEGSASSASGLLREVLKHKPLSTPGVSLLCWCEYLERRHETALALIMQARTSGHSGNVLDAVEALASVQIDEPAGCIPRLESLVANSPRHFTLRGMLGYAYAVTGQSQKAREVIEALRQPGLRGNCDYAYSTALTLLGLNETQRAVEYLQRSYRHGSLWSLGFHSDPILTPLRGHTGFIFTA
jgi:tetratricopeptide (TPR) repeat protein